MPQIIKGLIEGLAFGVGEVAVKKIVELYKAWRASKVEDHYTEAGAEELIQFNNELLEQVFKF